MIGKCPVSNKKKGKFAIIPNTHYPLPIFPIPKMVIQAF